MTLTYLNFLAVFVALPLSLLSVTAVVRSRSGQSPFRVQVGGIALMVGLALVYTTPWDNYLIAEGVWWYGEGTVSMRLWNMPLGEYLFVALQSVLVGLWTFQRDGAVVRHIRHSWSDRVLGAAAGVGVGLVGAVLLVGAQSTYYLGAILVWAGPVLALQWGVGWRYLVAIRRRLVVLIAVPVAYLSAIDLLAIRQGIWTISDVHTTGISLGGLPIEEAVFFFCTTLFIVQALVLLRWVIVRWG